MVVTCLFFVDSLFIRSVVLLSKANDKKGRIGLVAQSTAVHNDYLLYLKFLRSWARSADHAIYYTTSYGRESVSVSVCGCARARKCANILDLDLINPKVLGSLLCQKTKIHADIQINIYLLLPSCEGGGFYYAFIWRIEIFCIGQLQNFFDCSTFYAIHILLIRFEFVLHEMNLNLLVVW